MAKSDDPTVVETVVVSAADLVAALEASHRARGTETVLRITPPFSGRMRARLHVVQGDDGEDGGPIRIRAESLVGEACPAPPEPDDVEDELRAARTDAYTIDRHREQYRAALREWRTSVLDHVVEEAAVPATGGHVTVSILGDIDRE